MKKLIATRYISWIIILSVTMTASGTMLIGSINTIAFTSPLDSYFWNTILVNITFMGDAYFALGVVLFLMFFLRKKNLSLRLFLAVLFTLIITQAIKNYFSELPLQVFFEAGTRENSGENILYRNFISSHVAIAFTLAGFFALYFKNWLYKSILFVLAFLVSFSREELMGEPIETILLGIAPAFIATLFIYKFVRKKTNSDVYYYRLRKDRKITGEQIVHS